MPMAAAQMLTHIVLTKKPLAPTRVPRLPAPSPAVRLECNRTRRASARRMGKDVCDSSNGG